MVNIKRHAAWRIYDPFTDSHTVHRGQYGLPQGNRLPLSDNMVGAMPRNIITERTLQSRSRTAKWRATRTERKAPDLSRLPFSF